MNTAWVVWTIIGGGNTQPLLAGKKNYKTWYTFRQWGRENSVIFPSSLVLALAPSLALVLAPHTSHLVKLSPPNVSLGQPAFRFCRNKHHQWFSEFWRFSLPKYENLTAKYQNLKATSISSSLKALFTRTVTISVSGTFDLLTLSVIEPQDCTEPIFKWCKTVMSISEPGFI